MNEKPISKNSKASKPLDEMSMEELQAERERIWNSCSRLHNCTDGSLEMTLNFKGYFKVDDEIVKRLEAERAQRNEKM